MKKFHISLQWKFFLCIVLIIIPILGIIFTWAGFQNEKQSNDQVVNQARILSRQIILTRQWITDSGGVFVDLQSQGAKDITCFFDDKLETDPGILPAIYAVNGDPQTVPVFNPPGLIPLSPGQLNPLNPENKPDGFEREA